MTSLTLVALAALLSALLLTPLARRLAVRLDLLDRPGARKIHSHPTPLLGGLAVFCAAALSGLVLWEAALSQQQPAWGRSLAIWGGAALLLTVGILDDRGLIHPQIKLLGAMPLAASLLAVAGVRFQSGFLPSLFAEGSNAHWAASFALTVVGVTALSAAFNIFDHMDGLCAGAAAVAAAFFLAFAAWDGQPATAATAAALAGAASGFLCWNFHPAKIFLGDGGAMMLGFMLAALALEIDRFQDRPAGWMAPLLVLGVPLFDSALVTVSRLRRGLNPFSSPGKDHVAHRLANLGISQRAVALLYYAVGAALGFLAMLVLEAAPEVGYALLAALVAAAVAVAIALERVRFETQER